MTRNWENLSKFGEKVTERGMVPCYNKAIQKEIKNNPKKGKDFLLGEKVTENQKVI